MGHAQRTVDRPTESPTEDLTIRGGDDFLAEQGIADPDEFRVKSHLCHEIASIMEARQLTQAAAAEITGQKQADLSRIINHRHDGYGVWRLMKMLSALGADVLITVNPASGYDKGVIYSKNIEDQESEQPEPSADEQEEVAQAPGMRL